MAEKCKIAQNGKNAKKNAPCCNELICGRRSEKVFHFGGPLSFRTSFAVRPEMQKEKKTLPADLALADDGFWHFSDYRERREDVNGNVRNTANFC